MVRRQLQNTTCTFCVCLTLFVLSRKAFLKKEVKLFAHLQDTDDLQLMLKLT